MKTMKKIFLILNMAFITNSSISQDIDTCQTREKTSWFGVELNGILCGFSEENYCTGTMNGKKIRFERSVVTLKMTLLGAAMDLSIKSLYGIDPETERAVLINYDIQNGQTKITSETIVKNDTAFFKSKSSGIERIIPLDKKVILCSQATLPHLFNDFIRGNSVEKKYTVYEPVRGELQERGYILKGEEELILADSVFNTIIIEESDFATGLKTTNWLNKTDGFNVRVNVAGRNIYLADESIAGRISMVDMNNVLFGKVNKIIPDFMNLTQMRLKAKINSYGENITAESLNSPGQQFSGSVTGSLIDGIFKIEQKRYMGDGAPPFPPDCSKKDEIKKYLNPEFMIESDDSLIVAEAAKITSGSENSWIAALRLSNWVNKNIKGALPGGGSAKNTFLTREAECGGHSRLLAALCRAAGIPSRLSIGCMYTPYFGGSFGQHAWTEVYMGDAGWIAVDATIGETDFIDAGHVRLGEKANFQPENMEIIDYMITQAGISKLNN